jgi:hypothetical protein
VKVRALAIALLLAPLSPHTALAQRADAGHRLDRDGAVRIHNLVGAVRVTGRDRDSVAITATGAGARRLVSGGSTRGVKIAINEQIADGGGPSTTLDVRVPRGARIWIKTVSAPVTVCGVSGGLDVYTVSAPVTIAGSPRELRAEAMDGAITVDGAPTWARLKTATGDVTLRGGGTNVGLTSVSGSLRVEGGIVGRGRFETVDGAILFAARTDPTGSYEFDTHAGPVELRLAKGTAADVEVASLHGTIDNRLSADRPRTRADAGSRTLAASLGGGGGGAQVTVRTFKGAVRLTPP